MNLLILGPLQIDPEWMTGVNLPPSLDHSGWEILASSDCWLAGDAAIR
jgi:hypothetical protein